MKFCIDDLQTNEYFMAVLAIILTIILLCMYILVCIRIFWLL